MDGKSAMPSGLHARHVLFIMSVPMWEVLTLKKLLSQVSECFQAENAACAGDRKGEMSSAKGLVIPSRTAKKTNGTACFFG